MKSAHLLNRILVFVFLFTAKIAVFSQSQADLIPSDSAYLASIPIMVLSPESALLSLPSEVDNSSNIYFPNRDGGGLYMYNQTGETARCQSVATVFFTFTYEINRLRNVASNSQETRFAPNFSWNHLNHGFCAYQGWTGLDVVQVFLQQSGAMSDLDFDGQADLNALDCHRWVTGYDLYLNSMHNKLDSVQQFIINQDGSGLEILKHYLFDHNEGSNIGGVVTFGAKDYGVPVVTLLEPSAYAGQWVRYKMRDDVYHGHAVTIVGYNDNVMYDWGGAGTQSNPLPDGIYSNTNDNNLDGIRDMRDWEIGALKVANSYGDVPNQNNEGFEWVLYCCLPTFVSDHRNEFFALTPKESNEPGVVLKLKVDCEKRDDFLFGCGYGLNANSVTYIGDPSYFTGYSQSGGPYHIQGTDANGNDILGPIEFLLDFNHFFSDVDFGKVFLVVDKVGTSNGTVNSYALVDYRWNEIFELSFDQLNTAIEDHTVLGINYDLIPHENDIIYDLNLNSDMVSRFNPTVSHDATLAVSEGVQIDMYESEIHINQGSSLILGNDVTIQAKRGICKLVIDGDITVGSNVHFLAEGENQLYIQINNEQLTNLYFDGCSFENAALITYNNLNEITNSEFTGSAVFGFNGSYMISNCEFNSSITRFIGDGLSRLEDQTISFTDDCRFSDGISTAIEIDNYPNFRIQNCTISNFLNGISLYNTGYGRGYKLIADNVITENSNSGITSYRSYVDLLNNTIENNSIGIRSFDRSVMHIEGDSRFVTQIIKDNDSYELLASQGSFPQYFHWNLVQDDDNLADDPLVKYTGSAQLFDVRNNCWGLNFNPSTDLFPSGYIWNPIWNCFLGEGDGLYTETENIYLDAINKIDSGNYTTAKTDFKQIISSDPASIYAQAALKIMYSIEAFEENNYLELKNYYATDSNIINTPELEKLSDFLINFCEIKMENWPTAVEWFENEIINPESFEDSILIISKYT